MSNLEKTKHYDLEDRTKKFAKAVREILKLIPKSSSNIQDSLQLARSSGSVGANYIEANNSLSKKDFIMRIKICLKETKETKYWLELIDIGTSENLTHRIQSLIAETVELMNIFGAILRKSQ